VFEYIQKKETENRDGMEGLDENIEN